MTPPFKVGLLGSPGSGKTRIARRVARRLNTEMKRWVVVDGYVDKLAERTGRTFGEIYSRYAFPLNIQVAAERWTLEDEVTAKGMNTITCGTIYETFIYAAAQSMVIQHSPDEQWMLEETHVSQVMMSALATVSAIRFDYDLLLYLPLAEESHDWPGVVDAKLGEVLEGQNLVALVLNGTDKEKVIHATETIQTISKAAAARYEQRGIGTGGTASEGQEPEAEQVSDVPADEDAPES
jgi:hypothetical protein